MASKAMDVADACPTEDFIAALLEYLVEPKLHGESSAKGDISQIGQESIAKQVHAVALLYNYYHRKQYPQLEFLCFESFCKLAVVIKPALMAHIRLFQRSNDTESQPFPLLEESIMEACSISMSLDESEEDLNIDGWPISKVAVFLVDSRQENCFLQFGSITEGVWSVIEKDVDVSNNSLEVPMDSDHVNKKKRIIKKPLKGKSSSKEGHFQQFAFSAVKEATGIDQSNLVVLESHVTYSTSTEKTAVYFYIMQLTKADNSIALQIPIKNTIDSLQGPLALKSSSWWTHTSVVEYFLLLPYAEVLSDWLLREGLSDGVQVQRVGLETINISSSDWSERPCEAEVSERYHNHVNDSAAELLGSETITQSLKHNDNNGCLGSEMNSSKQNFNDKRCVVDLSGDRDRTQKMDVDESYMAHTQNKHKRRFSCKDQPQNCQKKTITADKCIEGLASKMETVEKCSKGSASGDKVDLVDWTISQKIPGCVGAVAADGNKNCNNIVADQDRMSVTDNAVVTCQSNSKNLDKLHTILVSKEKELSDAALTAVLSKRDRLGPLALKSSSWWTHTSVVEYFLLLPYAEVLSDWLLREGLSDGVQVQRVGLETINISSSDWSERPCEAEVSERYHNHVNDSAAELLGSETITQSLKHNDNNGCLGSEMNSSKQNFNDKRCVVDLSGDRDRTQKMDVDESYMAHTQNKHKRRFSCKDQPQNCQKKTITADKCIEGLASKMETVEKCSKGSASGDKVDLVDWTISQKIPGCVGAVAADGNKNCNNIVADQDRMSVTDNAVVTCQSNSKNLDKLHTILVSKEKELSDAALTVVLSKRDRLSLQLRDIEDQIAQCDKDIETILMGLG